MKSLSNIVCIEVSTPPQKHPRPLSCQTPLKFANCLTPSYLLKITKFLVKIWQFVFLVKTEKNILVYKLLLSLNISDFSSFFCKNCTP